MTSPDDAVTALRARLGQPTEPGEWLLVDQERVNAFADATGDHQWIHVDVERAKAGPFGGTIAHGYLSLSLLPTLAEGLVPREGFSGALNYGSDKVRYPQPLPVGTRIRATATPVEVVDHPLGFMVKNKLVVEGEGLPKPVCVAETLVLLLR
ncbi:MAG: dehydratase [Frankiales bacterium]|nr:dehydratase [Frankiales bacterium]